MLPTTHDAPGHTPEADQSCATCQGTGGHMEDTSSDGVTRRTWVRCKDCYGTGRQS